MSTRHCFNETVHIYTIGESGDLEPGELALEIQHLIESLKDYSWVNVTWQVGPEADYTATVYVHA